MCLPVTRGAGFGAGTARASSASLGNHVRYGGSKPTLDDVIPHMPAAVLALNPKVITSSIIDLPVSTEGRYPQHTTSTIPLHR
jgi:hypothetical protein